MAKRTPFKVIIDNNIDYILYGNKIGYINLYAIGIDISLIVVSIVNHDLLAPTQLWGLFMLILFGLSFVWQAISLGKDYRAYTRKTKYYNASSETQSLTTREIDDIYTERIRFSYGNTETELIYSDAYNRMLQGDEPIDMILSSGKAGKHGKEKNVIKYIKIHRDILLPFLNSKWHEMKHKSGSCYNEKKICMASEFNKSETGFEVKVFKGDYYNSYLTNIIYAKKLSHQSGWNLVPPVNNTNYPIPKLENSVMNDHIGISTLAITADGYVIVLKQNNKAMMSADKLMPSGSGSVDWKDLCKGRDFRETLKKAAHREFPEETKIDEGYIEDTTIIGFYRDLGRGGKPEICCLTRLNQPLFKLPAIEPESEEQRDDYDIYHIVGSANTLNGEGFEDFSNICNSKNASQALFMCCIFLSRFYNN